jgi:hypothetical protein
MRRTTPVPMPTWSGTDRGPRVLVEVSEGAKQHALMNFLSGSGYAVRGCAGPEASDHACPLEDGLECTGVAGADVVVHSMRHSDPQNRVVLSEIKRRYPDVPVIVEVPQPLALKHPEDFEGCHVIHQPITRESLLEAVEAALTT